MTTTTTSAIFFAARTAASVRCRLIEFASPDLVFVATQDDASSATCETPRKAIRTPLIVTTYGAQAAAAFAPMPRTGKCASRAAASVSARPTRP